MSEIDPELDATWRAASREQPPAIRAAARREVGAKPGGFRAAPRWWPLAAAATVAAIAVGIVQMTPPEQVTPAAISTANNTAGDAGQRDVKPNTDKPSANQPQREAPSSPAAAQALRDASKPAAKEQRRGAGDENDRGVLARNRSDSFAAPPKGEARDAAAAPEALHHANKSTAKERRGTLDENDRGEPGRHSDSLATAPGAQFQEKKALDSRQQAPPQRVEEAPERDQDLKQKTELAAAPSAARPSPAVSTPAASTAARNELQPFPAAPAPLQSGVGNVAPPMAAAAAAPPSNPSPAAAPAIAGGKLAAQSSATGALSGNIASAGTGDAEPAPAKDAAALEKRAAGMADKVTAERRKDTAPLAPDEWIKRIRRLIAEGKNADAAKELLAFRREYKERSDALLPSDLRAFRQ
jgi:hypothetical protein